MLANSLKRKNPVKPKEPSSWQEEAR